LAEPIQASLVVQGLNQTRPTFVVYGDQASEHSAKHAPMGGTPTVDSETGMNCHREIQGGRVAHTP
jgi:Ni2+-binding GTPase involved in maturation of urease and hydrogenase